MEKILNINLNNSSNFTNSNLGKIERNDSIKLIVDLLENVDYTDSKIRVLGKKSDNNFVEQIANINDIALNKLEIALKKDFTTKEGITRLEINIAQNSFEWTSGEFYFVVSNTLNSEIIESIENVATLTDLENYIIYAENEIAKIKMELESVSLEKLLEIKRLLEIENTAANSNIEILREISREVELLLANMQDTILLANTSNSTLLENINNANTSKSDLNDILGQANTINANITENIKKANTGDLKLIESIENANIAKNNLNSSISISGTSKINLDSSIENSENSKRNLDKSISLATQKVSDLEEKNTEASANILNLTEKIDLAGTSKTNLDNSISTANTTKGRLDESIAVGEIETLKATSKANKKEIETARGKSENLLVELNYRETRMLQNMKFQYLDFEGVGAITIQNAVNGHIKDMIITGQTKGGYDEISATSAPIVSSGMESGIVKVKSTGKNLYNPQYYKNLLGVKVINESENEIEISTLNFRFTKIENIFIKSKVYRIQAICTFILGAKGAIYVDFWYADGTTSRGRLDINYAQSDAGKTIEKITIDRSHDGVWNFKNLSLYEYQDGIATDYADYVEDKIEVVLPESMKLTGLKCSDTINLEEKKIYEKWEHAVFNGVNELKNGAKWNIATRDGTITRFFLHPYSNKKAGATNLLCDKLPTSSNAGAFEIGCSGYSSDGRIYIKVLNSVASTVNELVEYLKVNNHTFVFERENEIIHNIEIQKTNLTTFQNLTHWISENSTPAGASFKAPVDIPKTITMLRNENKNLRLEQEKMVHVINEKVEEIDHVLARINNAKI